jgi:DNA-binding MarR family transcriptional regulator
MDEAMHASRSDGNDEAHLPDIVTIAHALDDWNTLLGRQFGPLSRPQRRMLQHLHTEQAVRVSDLGEKLELTTAGTTRMLDKLEALGYAARTRDPHSDQRQVYVTLTERGKQVLTEANEAFLVRVRETLSVLDENERATLARLLRTIHRS